MTQQTASCAQSVLSSWFDGRFPFVFFFSPSCCGKLFFLSSHWLDSKCTAISALHSSVWRDNYSHTDWRKRKQTMKTTGPNKNETSAGDKMNTGSRGILINMDERESVSVEEATQPASRSLLSLIRRQRVPFCIGFLGIFFFPQAGCRGYKVVKQLWCKSSVALQGVSAVSRRSSRCSWSSRVPSY